MRAVRTFLFWTHLAVGCLAGLVILTMALTGVLLAFERQINAWADAPAALQIPAGAPPASLDSLVATLAGNGQGVPTELVLHNNPKAPVEARYGRERTLYLNPWTAAIVGQPSPATRSFFAMVERVHRSLGLGTRKALGRGLTGAANLAFLFMLLSGLYLWLPKAWNRAGLKRRLLFHGGLAGRAREWNWHNVIGIWTAFPLLFIVASGVVMSYPWANGLLYTLTGTQQPVNGPRGEARDEGPRRRGPGVPAPAPRSLDELAQVARQQTPSWKSMSIEMPRNDAPTLQISMDRSVGGQPEKASQLVLNRATGQIDAAKTFNDNNAGRKLRAWARFTHTGEEFGLPGQVIAAIASLGAVLLVWTGLSMAIRRLAAALRRRQPAATPVLAAAAAEPVAD